MKEIAKAYNHDELEEKIYQNWEELGYFKPCTQVTERQSDGETEKKPFVISMPPPNVTGKLHVGHSLFITLEDIMARYHRLKNEPTLWLPGTDHAGIATQTVVDKMLQKKGINKREIGRDKFVDEVWKWKEEYGNTITSQVRRMGASCDWSRERFTLDEGLNKAVNTAFVDFYNKGLIYQGLRVVNWCPKCYTAIADDEVEYEEKATKLYYFKYDRDFPITIATTRPETKFGDTGVGVNPSDERYKKYIGQVFDVDIDGVKRRIKIFADRSVDIKFGTGAVGVTPAHSFADSLMAENNGLKSVQVIDERGRMTDEAGKYAGLKVIETREKFVQYLKENNLLEKEVEIVHNVSTCYRCHTPIEPIPSKQWFVKMQPLAEKAVQAVKSGQIEILPKRFEKVYFHWMDNIRDWCISRQLWWGHQIPVWYRKQELKAEGEKLKADNIYVGVEPPKDIENWVQDEDVLDTWFSSGLWPFSTLGWPQQTEDLKNFYPTTVMETGYDILFFWVARMIMMGLELTGKAPFKTIYLHGLVRDEQNRKMSKSLGNVLDPLDIIPKYGTDALRMALVVGSAPGQDVAIGESKIKGYRNFSNKIWNASRFVILRVTDGDLQSGNIGVSKIKDLEIDDSRLTVADKEILDKHAETIKSVTNQLDKFRFSQAGEEMYEYFWHIFCDDYIEKSKVQLEDEKTNENTKKILIKVLTESLILLHPFVPFVTEAVWQEIRQIYPSLDESIMISSWPEVK